MKFTRAYVFDEAYNSASFAGSNEILMYDKIKRSIFNSNISITQWEIAPKIGDRIFYIYEDNPMEMPHPPVLLEILVNDKSVWKKTNVK